LSNSLHLIPRGSGRNECATRTGPLVRLEHVEGPGRSEEFAQCRDPSVLLR